METKANYVLIGAFTLAVVAAAFGFVFWFQNLGAAAQRVPLRIVFEGAASGLRTGGNVNFNGIKIGEVTSIKLDDPKRVVVITNVDKSAPIRKDSLVGLEFAGLTGVECRLPLPNAVLPYWTSRKLRNPCRKLQRETKLGALRQAPSHKTSRYGSSVSIYGNTSDLREY